MAVQASGLQVPMQCHPKSRHGLALALVLAGPEPYAPSLPTQPRRYRSEDEPGGYPTDDDQEEDDDEDKEMQGGDSRQGDELPRHLKAGDEKSRHGEDTKDAGRTATGSDQVYPDGAPQARL